MPAELFRPLLFLTPTLLFAGLEPAPQVITAEATFSHWSLFQRLCMVNEVLDAATLAGAAGVLTLGFPPSPPHFVAPCGD